MSQIICNIGIVVDSEHRQCNWSGMSKGKKTHWSMHKAVLISGDGRAYFPSSVRYPQSQILLGGRHRGDSGHKNGQGICAASWIGPCWFLRARIQLLAYCRADCGWQVFTSPVCYSS